MTPIEVKRFIRFALAQLRAENGHHAFEELCRYVSLARVSRNTIPATGPVGAGGDQGRDFETLRGYRGAGEPGMFGAFDDKSVVATCTLQQKAVGAKILSDISSIKAEHLLPADLVVAFTEVDVSVGTRNKIRSRAKTLYDVELQILDGNAIAELLSAHDLNWVAHRFLDLPSEAAPAPRADDDDAWYLDQRVRWADRQPRMTWGDLVSLREGLRYSYEQATFNSDVDWWIELLKPFTADDDDNRLRRAAIYEVVVGSLRGKATIAPYLTELDWYFSTIADVMPSGDLEDAQVLVSFCYGSVAYKDRGTPAESVSRWLAALVEHLDSQIAESDNPARLTSLLLSRGSAELLRNSAWDFHAAATYWERALSYADDATMFPVDQFALRLVPLAPAFAELDAYASLVARVDEKFAAQAGDVAVAYNIIDRAAILAESGKYAPALKEYHRARMRFLAGHDVSAAIRALAVIGAIYEKLGLIYAAKYSRLARASIAANSPDHDDRSYVAEALAEAATCDYLAGAWRGFLSLGHLSVSAHDRFDPEPGDGELYPFLESLGVDAGFVAIASMRHMRAFETSAVALASTLLGTDAVDDLRDGELNGLDDEAEFIKRVNDQLHVRPFDDCGQIRTLAWTAFGTTWKLEVENEPSSVAAAERFAATMQILQADLCNEDLVPLECELSIRLIAASDDDVHEPESGYTIDVSVPIWTGDSTHEYFERMCRKTMSLAVTVLGKSSTLTRQALMGHVKKRLEDDLTNKIAIFRLYDDVLDSWNLQPLTEVGEAYPLGEVPKVGVSAHGLAPAKTSPPGYSIEQARIALENRYRNLTSATQMTLARLNQLPTFLASVTALRDDGWLDWHILSAVLSIAQSYRANKAPSPAEKEAVMRTPIGDEPADVVPSSLFTEYALRGAHLGNNIATLVQTWERQLNVRRLNSDMIAGVLNRYNHYADDIEHPDPFVASPWRLP